MTSSLPSRCQYSAVRVRCICLRVNTAKTLRLAIVGQFRTSSHFMAIQLWRPISLKSNSSHYMYQPPAARPMLAAGFRSPGDVSLARLSQGPSWRPMAALDDWVAKEARPVSLRQLMFFGRSLNEARLLSSANYVRTELPTRLSHRIRDMQMLPYQVVSNRHIAEVYNMYWTAFDTFRKIKEIKSLADNDVFCEIISGMLKTHLTVIPKLAMGVLECSGLMDPQELNSFMNRILQSRISRRVIAEQHVTLTQSFRNQTQPWSAPTGEAAAVAATLGSASPVAESSDFVGNVLVKCVARDVVDRCAAAVHALARSAHGEDIPLPEIRVVGHLTANFPFILSHLEYIIGELLRNSVDATVEQHQKLGKPPPPIEVTICESSQHVIIRVSDQGGGVARDMLPYLWSFSKGPHSDRLLQNLKHVPKMAATLQEVRPEEDSSGILSMPQMTTDQSVMSSLSSLSSRPPNLKLGVGLPLSRVYAEYWAGSLELHSLEGYGVDTFLQISKLGNKNEQLATRASIDAV
ncbi:hypothetical protein PpBr36_02378 [Pyricularia pennisetigena]|uniref:hypothetical protein n=1 Tax=Pyricularia pennisetigena TaxID=1578925 RepID=UPI001154B948|nr:hypothetical protein PpBr36_02378 [Pyricularia pennisetigena]TLS31134.1 hypothetical protein PpBr36_02378 [Pyricularia pennisetigena]